MKMILKKILAKVWAAKQEPELTPEYIEALPSADDITFYRDSKRLLQRFDEYVTAAETEAETLSIELDTCLTQGSVLETQIRNLNKPNSWHERYLLLKIDRLHLHCNNLKQRIEIYSQNINIYSDLISKIQDIKAMRMNGLDEKKMEMIWIDFKETLDLYKDRLGMAAATTDSEGVTTQNLETRLETLRKHLIKPAEESKSTLDPPTPPEPAKPELEIKINQRPPLLQEILKDPPLETQKNKSLMVE